VLSALATGLDLAQLGEYLALDDTLDVDQEPKEVA
jgi:hypothetical protein